MIGQLAGRLRYSLDSGRTLSGFAAAMARSHGDRTAHVLDAPLPYARLPRTHVSFHDVDDFVRAAARVLWEQLGVRPGDRVLLTPSNRIDSLYWLLAVAAAGATPVPVNPQYKAAEVTLIADDCGARVAITDLDVFRSTIKKLSAAPRIERWGFLGPAHRSGRCISLPRLVDRALGRFEPRVPDSGQPALILYTSGTTGTPKGAVLSNKALLSGTRLASLYPGLPGGELLLSALPLAHVMGLSSALMTMAAGLPHLHLRRFDAETLLSLAEEHRPTLFVGVPTMYRRLESAGAAFRDLTSIRFWCSAADVMPPELIESFKGYGRSLAAGPAQLEAAFVEVYGLVEAAGGAMLRISPPGRRPSTAGFVGLPIPPWRARVLDDLGGDAPRGEVGELVVKGPGVLDEYLGRPDATSTTIRQGWLHTGDLAWRDRLGLIHFVSREKEVVKCGGYSVYPAEVEALLRRHPEVVRATVFGVPHERLGEETVAAIVLAAGAASDGSAVQFWARANMADYKAPRRVEIVREDELPLNATGKVLRRELASRFGAVAR